MTFHFLSTLAAPECRSSPDSKGMAQQWSGVDFSAACKNGRGGGRGDMAPSRHNLSRLRIPLIAAVLALASVIVVALSGCGSSIKSMAGGGSLVASPSTVTFGSVAVGQKATATVTLTNMSPTSAQISQVNMTGQSFSLGSKTTLPVTVAAGETYSLQLTFAPAAAGASTGQVTFTGDSSSAGVVTTSVGLSGTGMAETPVLSGLTCASTTVTGSMADACTLTLNSAAPSGGLTVDLSSSTNSVVVPATLTVPASATSANFTANVASVTTAQTVVLTASAGSISKVLDLQLSASIANLSISPSSVAFGNVALNTATNQPVVLSATGTQPISISAATATGAGFSTSGVNFPVTLSPGQSTTLNVAFDPTVAGTATGQVTLKTKNSSGVTTNAIALSGTGLAATPVLNGFSCENASMTGSVTDACTVTLGSVAPAGGLTVNVSSNNSAVTVPALVTIPANATSAAFEINVTWVATAQTAVLTASEGGFSKAEDLQLNAATPTLGISTTSIAFGNVSVNSSATQTVTLSSTGTEPVTITAAAATGTGFSESGLKLPLTLNPGQTATLNIAFDPTVAGAATGQVTLASNSSTGGSAAISLSGTGESGSYKVNLTWDAPGSSEDPVAGYNVYREPSSGTGYQMLNSSVVSETSYVDSTVQSGQSYSYLVESVDAAGVQSTPSNTFTVTIP